MLVCVMFPCTLLNVARGILAIGPLRSIRGAAGTPYSGDAGTWDTDPVGGWGGGGWSCDEVAVRKYSRRVWHYKTHPSPCGRVNEGVARRVECCRAICWSAMGSIPV